MKNRNGIIQFIFMTIFISSKIYCGDNNKQNNNEKDFFYSKAISISVLEKSSIPISDYLLQYNFIHNQNKGFRVGLGLNIDSKSDKGDKLKVNPDIYGNEKYNENEFEFSVQLNFQYFKYIHSNKKQ